MPLDSTPIFTDERIRSICIWFARSNANVKGRPNMKAADFQQWVNTFLIPTHLPELHGLRTKAVEVALNKAKNLTWSISLTTAKRWLGALGFRKTKHKKTMYIDGHERADVVLDRRRFIDELKSYVRFMRQYSGDNMDVVTLPASRDHPEVVLIVLDETVDVRRACVLCVLSGQLPGSPV